MRRPILGSRDAAEDVVQDAFLKFIPAKARTETPEQGLAYLYRIVRNLAFDVLKRRKIETRETNRDVPYWGMPREEPTPERNTLFCDEVRCVAEVLAEVSPECRIAVEMHRFGGYTLEEVADHLGVSVATVHRCVRAVMVRIAERLDQGRA